MAAKARVTVEHAEQVHFFRPSVGCRGGSPGARGRARASIRSCALSGHKSGRVVALLERRARPGQLSRDREHAGGEEGPLDVGPMLVRQRAIRAPIRDRPANAT